MRYGILVLVLIAFNVSGCLSVDSVNRGSTLSWSQSGSFKSHNYTVVEDTTGSAPASKIEIFEVRDGDCANSRHGDSLTTDCNSGRTRTEMGAFREIVGNFKERWYGLSIYFPEEYVSDSPHTNPIFAQILASDEGEAGQPPTLTLSESNGALILNGILIAEGDELRQRWHNIKIHAKWTSSRNGFLRLYHDDKLIYSRDNVKTTDRKAVQFKYGIYRFPDFMTRYPKDWKYPTQRVYFSNVKVSRSKDGLSP